MRFELLTFGKPLGRFHHSSTECLLLFEYIWAVCHSVRRGNTAAAVALSIHFLGTRFRGNSPPLYISEELALKRDFAPYTHFLGTRPSEGIRLLRTFPRNSPFRGKWPPLNISWELAIQREFAPSIHFLELALQGKVAAAIHFRGTRPSGEIHPPAYVS